MHELCTVSLVKGLYGSLRSLLVVSYLLLCRIACEIKG